MSISTLYNTQGIIGYNYQKTERIKDTEIYYLHSKAKRQPCPKCRSWNTKLVKTGKTRDIKGLCIGLKKTIMRVFQNRIICGVCNASSHEKITFCPDPYVRYTKL